MTNLTSIIMRHTDLSDPPRFNPVKIAEEAYALGRCHGRGDAMNALEALCEAAFLAGANPDHNHSRHLVDRAIDNARRFLAKTAETRAALAAGSGTAETRGTAARCEASQSGPKGNAQPPQSTQANRP